MRTPIHAAAVAAIALAAAFTSGCENDLDPLAPSDGVINLQANPSTIVLNPGDPFAPRDPETGLLVGTSNIYATVFDKTGHPLGGVAVYFTTTAGRLGSASGLGQPPRSVTTDANGTATDTLTVKESDPTDTTVTATSSILSKTLLVKRTTANCVNAAPVANAGADPTIPASTLAVTVKLDGSLSSDTETSTADLLFTWDCGNSTEPTAAEGFEDDFPKIVACEYEPGTATTPAVYTATLSVTDTGNGEEDPRTGDFLCKETTTDTVKISVPGR